MDCGVAVRTFQRGDACALLSIQHVEETFSWLQSKEQQDQRCANIHLVLEYMCVYTSKYSHVLCYCEQDTVPPYPYCIKEDRLDVALEDCWYARPQLFYKFYLRPKLGQLLRNGTYKAGPGIYQYIRLYTCMYVMIFCLPDDLLREVDFGVVWTWQATSGWSVS